MRSAERSPLLEARQVGVDFLVEGRWLPAVEEVSFVIGEGETLCLVGESGSGKSVTALSIGRLLPRRQSRVRGGGIWFRGRDLTTMSPEAMRGIRGRDIAYIFQEPSSSLNPIMRVGDQILESLRSHRVEAATEDEVVRLLAQVGISEPRRRVRAYPHQLSGGMQQRVMIAMAIASRPALLIADEPTTALDVTIQAQVLALLNDLKRELGMAVLLITHNLALVPGVADSLAVMYAGQIVEQGPARAVLHEPYHPYTRALMDCLPVLGARHERLRPIDGTIPSVGAWPDGCHFHPRCPRRQDECLEAVPRLLPFGPDRGLRCGVVSGELETEQGHVDD